MVGFTNGAICIDTYQEDHLSGTMNKILFEEKDLFNEHNEVSESEESYNKLEGYLPESETEDNELEDCSDGCAYESFKTEQVCTKRVHEVRNVPDEKDLENVDWERFYNSGELGPKVNANSNIAQDVQQQSTGEASLQDKENKAWNNSQVEELTQATHCQGRKMKQLLPCRCSPYIVHYCSKSIEVMPATASDQAMGLSEMEMDMFHAIIRSFMQNDDMIYQAEDDVSDGSIFLSLTYWFMGGTIRTDRLLCPHHTSRTRRCLPRPSKETMLVWRVRELKAMPCWEYELSNFVEYAWATSVLNNLNNKAIPCCMLHCASCSI